MSGRRGGVLILCDANVCRSVLAELMIKRVFEERPLLADVPVRSAGVRARDGMRACALIKGARSDRRWVSLADDHRSRPAEPSEIDEANIVLAVSRSVRSEAVVLAPEARRRVFTLLEAVWLSGGDEVLRRQTSGFGAVDALVRLLDGQRGLWPMDAATKRGLFQRPRVDPLDIPDGHNSWRGAHKKTIRTVAQSAQRLSALVVASIDEPKRPR